MSISDQSYKAAPIVTILSSGPRHSAESIREAFGGVQNANSNTIKQADADLNVSVDPMLTAAQRKELVETAVDIFNTDSPNLWAGDWQAEKDVLRGGVQAFDSQSQADYSVIRNLAYWFARRGVPVNELQQLVEDAFDQSGLAKRDKWQNREDYRRATIEKALQGIETRKPLDTAYAGGAKGPAPIKPINLSLEGLIDTSRSTMPPREFAGPKMGDAALFPLNALSLFVASGGAGKTSVLISMACHIAAGKRWGTDELKRRKVAMFFVEEDSEELNRKANAVIETWSDDEKALARQNLRVISLMGRESCLTKAVGREINGTGLALGIASASERFGAEVIVCDHLQGFTSGDLNNSDTATKLAAEATIIINQTKAAVVFTAHTTKGSLGADKVTQGFASGSMAFENAARQMTGLIPLPENDAKRFCGNDVERVKKLEMPKNSYGKAMQSTYVESVFSPNFHTIYFRPIAPQLPTKGSIQTKDERLRQEILAHIASNPGCSRNQLDKLAGKKGPFKASREAIRRAVKHLEEDDEIGPVEVTDEIRRQLNVDHRTKTILQVTEGFLPAV